MKRFLLIMIVMAVLSLTTFYFMYDAWSRHLNHWVPWGIVMTMTLAWGAEMLNAHARVARYERFARFVKHRLNESNVYHQKVVDDLLACYAIVVSDASERLMVLHTEGLRAQPELWTLHGPEKWNSVQLSREFEDREARLKQALTSAEKDFNSLYDEVQLHAKFFNFALYPRNWKYYHPESLRNSA